MQNLMLDIIHFILHKINLFPPNKKFMYTNRLCVSTDNSFGLELILIQVAAHFTQVACIYCHEVRLHPLYESQMFAGLHKAYLIISSLFKHNSSWSECVKCFVSSCGPIRFWSGSHGGKFQNLFLWHQCECSMTHWDWPVSSLVSPFIFATPADTRQI